jgi:4-alpha-glucanotransferase
VISRRVRAAGILAHVTSLPGRFGIGDLGPGTVRFLDWVRDAGFSVWQILPLNPADRGNSPYGGASAFAGNPCLLSPEWMFEDGVLPAALIDSAPPFPPDRVDYAAVVPWKETLLRASWAHVRRHGITWVVDAVHAFARAPEQTSWLDDWALFAALRERYQGAPWTTWAAAVAQREPAALDAVRAELADAIEYQQFVQWLFHRQWARIHAEARTRGVRVLGDLPIYVAGDSADVWANPRLFQIDAQLRPTAVSGVPPDYFSDTGQLWGTPLFDWNVHRREGWSWWIERVRANLRVCDVLRVDHFRAFAAYWAVPAGASTAAAGHWEDGPGEELFAALESALGGLPLVAEDLGHITDDVRALLARTGLPGMKVLQFAFHEPDSDYLPHRHVADCVVYTGTHDNDTARGWWEGLDDAARQRARDYLGTNGGDIPWDLIRAAMGSVADRAVVPVQDLLGLDSTARMNQPSTAVGNWRWRLRDDALDAALAGRVRRLLELTGRLPRG